MKPSMLDNRKAMILTMMRITMSAVSPFQEKLLDSLFTVFSQAISVVDLI